jgi:hypothetical protein
MPPNPPPPPPRKAFQATTSSSVVKQSSNADLLTSIQKGTKLKKVLVTKDRSAPLIQKACSQAEGNSVEKPANPLFSGGFPKLKSVKEGASSGGIREEIERKLFERSNGGSRRELPSVEQRRSPERTPTMRNEKRDIFEKRQDESERRNEIRNSFEQRPQERLEIRNHFERKPEPRLEIQSSFEKRPESLPQRTSNSQSSLSANRNSYDNARETVRSSLNQSSVNKTQRQELPERNNSFVPPSFNLASSPKLQPQSNSSLFSEATHKFDLSYVPKTPPRIRWPPKCTYASGEREGLNKFIQNPAPFLQEDPMTKASESKVLLSKALQTAIEREDFETCVELKAAMKSLEASTSIDQIERIMRKLEHVL